MTQPMRRSSDDGGAGLWGAVDELRLNVRTIAPVVVEVARHGVEIDGLQEWLKAFEERSKARFDQADAVLAEINAHVKVTNGRVGALETRTVVDEALRAAAAVAVEERRHTLALRIAQRGWMQPTIAGGGVAIVVMGLGKLFGLA